MTRKHRFSLLFGILLVLCTISFAWVATACDSSEYHRASDAAAKISTTLKTAPTEVADVYKLGGLSREQYLAVLVGLDCAVSANDVFTSHLQAAKQITASQRAVLALDLKSVSACVDGVSSVTDATTDANAQSKLRTIVLTVRGAIDIIATIAGSPGPTVKSTTYRETDPNLLRTQMGIAKEERYRVRAPTWALG